LKVELKDIHKHFGPVPANEGVTLSVESGTLHGLLGENGAGKSTLMKVLSGFLSPDKGEILIDGMPVRFFSTAQAVALGIGMLHQDPLDFPALTVLDNFLLGDPSSLRLDRQHARSHLVELAAQLDFKLDPKAWVSNLSIGERQQLEIVRLLWMGVNLLILDEPTTAISAQQKNKLFTALRKLTDQKKTILFVSHKLEEVKELCGKVTVLARGKVTGECEMPCPTEKLVEMMFGQTITVGKRSTSPLGNRVLDLSHLTLNDWRLEVKDLSLQIHAGEVIGLAGLEGSGQHLVLKACAGLIRPKAGHIRMNHTDMTGRPYHQFLEAGVTYMATGRLEEGLIAGMTLTEHFALTKHHPPFWVNWVIAQETAAQRIQEFKIRGKPTTPVEDLSGGNQQRTLLSLLPPHSKILLMEHPTRGLDLESTEYIWEILLNRARGGTAILFISSELDELLDRSHRILVFFGGRVRVLETSQVNGIRLGESIGGKGFES
jgi:simple sugar transport system ATP-binding protein